MRIDKELLRRFVVVVFSSLWIGGLTVYTLLAIPAGHEVLGSHLEVGFITRRVTVGLNVLGVLMAAVLGWDLRVRGAGRRAWIAWGGVVLIQGFLFVWHPVVDAWLDPGTRSLAEGDGFYILHRVYLWVSLLQWLAALGLVAAALAGWQRLDRRRG